MKKDETLCNHYDEQVGITVHTDLMDIDPCFWCDNSADIAFQSSGRWWLLLCIDCLEVLQILAQDDD